MKSGNLTEKKTITAMIRIYCRAKHDRNELCGQCRDLNEYALKRIDHCIFGVEKPVCKICPVHCYSPLMRERIREVMRFAGPRILTRHPGLAIKHMVRERMNAGKEVGKAVMKEVGRTVEKEVRKNVENLITKNV